jgi:hypothetical protein
MHKIAKNAGLTELDGFILRKGQSPKDVILVV